MLNRKQRVLLDNGGASLVDISAVVNRHTENGAKVINIDENHAIYIGSELPFNHRWFEFGAANDVAAILSCAIWNASIWEPVSDMLDGTDVDGATFGKAGAVSFEPDVDKPGWALQYKSQDINALSTGPQIINLFWMRVTLSGAVNVLTSIQYIGQRFSTDQDLFDLYPDLNRTNLMAAFAAGKTDWTEQGITAAEYIVDDLRQRHALVRREQIMDTTILKEACIHKTAEIIYRGLGNGHLDNRILAAKDYSTAMRKDFYELDLTGDGRASGAEKTWSTSFGTR